MTPDERVFLQTLGDLLVEDILGVSIFVLFFVVFIGPYILACLSFLNRGFGNSWARWALLAALLLTFLTSVVSVIQPIADFAIVATHLNSLDPAAIGAELAPYDISVNWASQIGILINDSVVVWRAWVLYRDRPIVLFSLCLTFCGTLATGLACLALISTVSTFLEFTHSVSSSGVATQSTVALTLNSAATVLSLATNLFATSLTLLQLWRHRGYFGRSGFHYNSLTSSQRILLFLVEAGVIFYIGQAFDLFFVFYIASRNDVTSAAYSALTVIDIMFWASLPMYLPAVILFTVNNRTIQEYISYDLNLFEEAVDVEVVGHEEGGPMESSTWNGSTHSPQGQ